MSLKQQKKFSFMLLSNPYLLYRCQEWSDRRKRRYIYLYFRRKNLDLGLGSLFMYPWNTNAIMLAQNYWLPSSVNSKTVNQPISQAYLQGEKKRGIKKHNNNYLTAILHLSSKTGNINILEITVQIPCSSHNHPPLVISARNTTI